VPRDSNGRGSPTAAAEHDEQSDRVPRVRVTPGPDELAREFLDDIAGRAEPWPALALAWACRRGLTVLELKALQRQIIRQRVFGAVERHARRRR
jgi:hypothetical protein